MSNHPNEEDFAEARAFLRMTDEEKRKWYDAERFEILTTDEFKILTEIVLLILLNFTIIFIIAVTYRPG
jgi:hypothetical protein